jgi:thiosulfate dehydrogenase (quinone) large subunit
MQIEKLANFATRSSFGEFTGGSVESAIILLLRLALGYTFLIAGVSQLMTPNFSVVPFLSETKTFHALMMVFASPGVAGPVSVLVKCGQTLIGLSLISGCLVRMSASFGAALMFLFYLGHMDWPYIQYNYNIIIDFHLVYVLLLIYLNIKRAGEVWGLDWFWSGPLVGR